MRQKLLGDAHPDVAASLCELAMFLQFNGSLAEAESLMRQCVDIRKRVFPSGDWRTATANCSLGAILSRQGKYQEAEPLLLAAYEDVRAHPPPPAQAAQLGEVVSRIVQLYQDWGKPEKAAEWLTKLPAPAIVPCTAPLEKQSGR